MILYNFQLNEDGVIEDNLRCYSDNDVSKDHDIRDVIAVWSWHRAGHRLIASSNSTFACLWLNPRGVAWDAVPEPTVE